MKYIYIRSQYCVIVHDWITEVYLWGTGVCGKPIGNIFENWLLHVGDNMYIVEDIVEFKIIILYIPYTYDIVQAYA